MLFFFCQTYLLELWNYNYLGLFSSKHDSFCYMTQQITSWLLHSLSLVVQPLFLSTAYKFQWIHYRSHHFFSSAQELPFCQPLVTSKVICIVCISRLVFYKRRPSLAAHSNTLIENFHDPSITLESALTRKCDLSCLCFRQDVKQVALNLILLMFIWIRGQAQCDHAFCIFVD